MNLIRFLSHAKASSDLRELMLKYSPLQTPWVYDGHRRYWPRDVLDEVRKMVRTPFLYYVGDFIQTPL